MSVTSLNNVSAREVAAVLLRSWLAKMQVPTRRLGVIIGGLMALVTAVSILLVLLTAKNFLYDSPVILGIVLINVHVLTMLTGIVSSAATAQESSTMSWWRVSPLTDRRLGRGLSIPVWGVAAAQAILIVPVVTVMFGQGQGSYFDTAFLLCVALMTGTVLGRLLLVFCRVLCRYVSMQFVSRAQLIAVCAWIVYAGLSVYVTRQILDVLMEGRALSWWAALGYPLLMVVAAESSAVTWFGVFMMAIVMVFVEIWVWPRAGFEKYDGSKVSTLGISYLSCGPLPILRLELLRFIRYPRAQVILFTIIITQIISLGIYWNFRYVAESMPFSSIILTTSFLIGCLPVLARGLSDRNSPYAMLMGLNSHAWAFTVNIGSIAVSFAATFPFLAIWAALSSQTAQLYSGFSVLLFTAAAAGVVGFTVMPAADTGVVEGIAMITPSFITAGVIWILQGAGLEKAEQFSPILLGAGLLLLLVPSIIEKVRWNEFSGVKVPQLDTIKTDGES